MNIRMMLLTQIRDAGKRSFDAALAEARSAGGKPVDGEEGVFDCNFESMEPFQIKVTTNEAGGVAVAVL